MRLADRVEPVADEPRRGWIAVHRQGRSILRSIGERLAVARRPDLEPLDGRCRLMAGCCPVNTGSRWSAVSRWSTSVPGPPVSVKPTTSCVPRHW